jgi:glycine dehydrogenase
LEKLLPPLNTFYRRHVGPSADDATSMLQSLDPPASSLDEFVSQTIPQDIRLQQPLSFPQPDYAIDPKSGGLAESEAIAHTHRILEENKLWKSYIGAGYYGTIVPEVIKRNVLESPAWYTSYTPYQAEVSQGRLESLLNFQTMVSDLTALPIANASVLDEATAAAEAMTLSMNALPMARQKRKNKTFVVSHLCHPQTIAVLESRSTGFGIHIQVGDLFAQDHKLVKDQGDDLIGVLAQYPDTEGGVYPLQSLADATHHLGASLSVATDLLALTLLKPPGEFGADIAFGSAQRFGVPMGYGGPHAAFFACSDKFKRKIPGRLVGVSKDRLGNRALRLALQTREQHIRREKATSNICTAQALLANMSAFYAVYHGPEGLRAIAEKIRMTTRFLQKHMEKNGWKVITKGTREDGAALFDTIVVEGTKGQVEAALDPTKRPHLNLRIFSPTKLGVSLDETVISRKQLLPLCRLFGPVSEDGTWPDSDRWAASLLDRTNGWSIEDEALPSDVKRTSSYLTHPVFNSYHSETELLRYIHHLQSKDLSLVHSMIPLGSCTMKLNATAEMIAVSHESASQMHPFAPIQQAQGYRKLIALLSDQLNRITGMDDVSLQPNSGAQGEFTGLRVIKKYLDALKDGKTRMICLIPVSAHGTNPASAAMAGMKVVPLKCEPKTGNLDITDLEDKCRQHKDELAAIMITYPSTFGVFEPEIKKVCSIVHEHGGQVYMDGANLNAQMGLCNPGEIGADVCHLNLHKTFCIPHGGGGPGVGPIAVKSHLAKYLPSHPFVDPHASDLDMDSGPVNRRTMDQGFLLPSYDDATSNLNEAGQARAKNRDSARALAISPVSAAPWGSASILPISFTYNRLMGGPGLTEATKITLLNANYLMSRLKAHYPILYTNSHGRCAHEFILDARRFKESAGIEAIDLAKRLQDYGFHAPTMSWPVAGTLMVEPTESESRAELDRFCDALICIRHEIGRVERGEWPRQGNVLKMAPHTQADLMRDDWDRCYSREEAAYPLPWLREKKFWPTVCRVDDGKCFFFFFFFFFFSFFPHFSFLFSSFLFLNLDDGYKPR